mmetsp:Transcript_91660/g.255953  ORF Transcript_91660/g.255953 Transcript_91660/m.255953 type:complete len:219 (-) Transcript_91660:382-1038(-)
MILCAQAVRIFLPRIGLVALRGLGPRLHGAAPVQDVPHALGAGLHRAPQRKGVPRLLEVLDLVHEDYVESRLVVGHARRCRPLEQVREVALAPPVQIQHHHTRVEGRELVLLVEVFRARPPLELVAHDLLLDRARRNRGGHLRQEEAGHIRGHDGVHVKPQDLRQVVENLVQVEAGEDGGLAELVLVAPAAREALRAGAHARSVPRQGRHHVQGRRGD